MEAIVLAGGLGTRLKSVVNDVPKPMAEVNGKPFLYYILEFLQQNGIKKVVLSVGYKKEIIESYFKDNFHDIEVFYSREDNPLGTGGAIKQALRMCQGKQVIVLNGDTFFNVNLDLMLQQHKKSYADVTLAVKKMYNFDRYGKVMIQDYRIIQFSEKEWSEEGYINGGVYIVERTILENYDKKFSFEADFLEKKKGGLKFYAYKSEGYFIDIGIPEDYKKAIFDFGDKKALFLDRDGIVNIDYGHVHKKEEFVFIESIFELCLYFQQKGYQIFIITNQAGIAKGYYSREDFYSLTDWMLSIFFQKGIQITEVFYCPHHPTEGKGDDLVSCECRKPKPKMLLDAQEKYSISLKKSLLLGDKRSDIIAGKRAGIEETVLIQSRYQKEYDYESIKEFLKQRRENDNLKDTV